MAWAIRGTWDWYAESVRNPTKPSTGLVVPEVVRLADQYQQDNAPLHENWLDQRWMITWSADDKINTADLRDDFDGWAKQKRITEKIGKQKFSVVNFRPEEILGSMRVGPLNSLFARNLLIVRSDPP